MLKDMICNKLVRVGASSEKGLMIKCDFGGEEAFFWTDGECNEEAVLEDLANSFYGSDCGLEFFEHVLGNLCDEDERMKQWNTLVALEGDGLDMEQAKLDLADKIVSENYKMIVGFLSVVGLEREEIK